MKGKLVILTLALTFISLVSFGQLSIGVRGGLGLAKEYSKVGGSSLNSEAILSFHVGGTGCFGVPLPVGAVEVESGIQFTRLGGKVTTPAVEVGGKEVSPKTEAKTSRYYLEVPIRLNYRMDLSGIGIYAGVGPQFGFGLFGKHSSGSNSTDVKFGSKIGETNRMNIALSMQLGVIMIGKIRVAFYYDLGLKDHSNSKSNDVSSTDHVYGITGSYFFF